MARVQPLPVRYQIVPHGVMGMLIFVVTGRPGEGHRAWAGDLRNVEFVEKPASLRHLITRIDERSVAEESVDSDLA